jgi:hypothetical protein
LERRLKGLDDEEVKPAEKKKPAGEGEEGADGKGEKAADAVDDDVPKDEDGNPIVKKEEEWKPFIPETPSSICWALYSSEDTIWLSMDDYDCGYLYECKLLEDAQKNKNVVNEPVRAIPVEKSSLIDSEDVPLTYMINE